MFTCTKCSTVYLREVDMLKCMSKEIDKPVIKVGSILIDNSYGVETLIRCYWISNVNHQVVYNFEWERDQGKWEHAYQLQTQQILDVNRVESM